MNPEDIISESLRLADSQNILAKSMALKDLEQFNECQALRDVRRNLPPTCEAAQVFSKYRRACGRLSRRDYHYRSNFSNTVTNIDKIIVAAKQRYLDRLQALTFCEECLSCLNRDGALQKVMIKAQDNLKTMREIIKEFS